MHCIFYKKSITAVAYSALNVFQTLYQMLYLQVFIHLILTATYGNVIINPVSQTKNESLQIK